MLYLRQSREDIKEELVESNISGDNFSTFSELIGAAKTFAEILTLTHEKIANYADSCE